MGEIDSPKDLDLVSPPKHAGKHVNYFGESAIAHCSKELRCILTPSGTHHEEPDEELSYINDMNPPDRPIPHPDDPGLAESVPHGELNEERSELSYVNYEDQRPTDCSILPSNDLGLGSGPRFPYVAISSWEHSLHQSYRRGSHGSDGSPTVEVQHLSTLHIQVTNLLTGGGTQVSDPPTGVHTQPQNSSTVATDTHPHDASKDIQNLPVPTHNSNGSHGGTPPPQINIAPSTPPLHRIRTRGAFLIGNGAPMKIDESIEVRLRDGANGQVDFII